MIITHAMDIVMDLPVALAPAMRRALPPLSLPRKAGEITSLHLPRFAGEIEEREDRAPGMPLLGFVIAMALSAPLWALIGFTAWVLLT